MSVVVGVSPTTGSPAALRWGAEEARLRDLPLRAVMAWRAPRAPGSPGGRPPTTSTAVGGEQNAEAAESTLRGFVSDALGTDVRIDCLVVRGSAVKALLASAQGAQVLVVGEPRSGRIGSVRTSLVAPQVVLHATCPVVVMPSRVAAKG